MPDAQVLPDSIAGSSGTLVPAFTCSWTDGGSGAAWVRIAGELDLAAVPQLKQTLESRLQALLIVLDLRRLEFIDISGARAIVNAGLRARQAGRRLVLLPGPPTVDRMLKLIANADEFEIGDIERVEPTVEALLQLTHGEPA